MHLGPMLRSMHHHKGAFSLLVLEVAFGFVLLSHTLVGARYYLRLHQRPTGLPHDELLIATRRFAQPRAITTAREVLRGDLAALATAGIAAAAIDPAPLTGSTGFPAALSVDDAPGTAGARLVMHAWPVRATDAFAKVQGTRLIAGRTFTGTDSLAGSEPAADLPPALISRSVATALFGDPARALGHVVAGGTWHRARVVGVVQDFNQRGSWMPHATAQIVVAAAPVTEHDVVYTLRATKDGRDAVAARARQILDARDDAASTVTVAPVRLETTRFAQLSRGATVVLLWTGFLVVAVALAGSLALASFSVTERRRQIGIRRALGARRGEIIGYFLIENLMLTAIGLAIGLTMALVLNQLLRRIMTELVLSVDAIVVSVAIFTLTGLLSALVPARRAAAIPPWAATRTL